MGRPTVDFHITFDGKRRNRDPFLGLVDTGAAETVLPAVHAQVMKLGKLKPNDVLQIGGDRVPVRRMMAVLQVPGTDCFVDMPVAVATDRHHDVIAPLLGADFLERAGAMLDMRHGRHGIACDLHGRDPVPPSVAKLQPKMLRRPRPSGRRA